MNKLLLKTCEYLATSKTDGINNAEDIELITIKASNKIIYEAFWVLSHSNYNKNANNEKNNQVHFFIAREQEIEKYAILCVVSEGSIKETDLGLVSCKVYFLQDIINKRVISKIKDIFTPIIKTYEVCPYVKKIENKYYCTLKDEICLPYFYYKSKNTSSKAMCTKEVITNIKKNLYIKRKMRKNRTK